MKKLLLMVVAASCLAIAGAALAQAQVVDTIEADVPFSFTVSNTTLPAGEYNLKRLGRADPGVMEIRSADGKQKVIFLAGTAEAAKDPDQAKLIFDRVGDQYFLSEIFEEGNRTGAELKKSRTERRLEEEGAVSELRSFVLPAHAAVQANR